MAALLLYRGKLEIKNLNNSTGGIGIEANGIATDLCVEDSGIRLDEYNLIMKEEDIQGIMKLWKSRIQ